MNPTGNTLFHAFNRIRKSSMRRMHKLPQHLKPHEFFMLSTISRLCECHQETPGIKISQISKKTGISMPGVSQTLSTLEKLDLIERRPAKQDRRIVYVSLTEKGLKLFHESNHAFSEVYDQAMQIIGPEDSQKLIDLLNQLADAFEEIENNSNLKGNTQ
ncbi:MarR family winged helix-turn-helix transcriptional regulator [Eubacteriaceae bacterium ES3]|nr:MarR family winged helix-turn-helix transcriptional regulator [Eubacteriaceae bacterium ES3]